MQFLKQMNQRFESDVCIFYSKLCRCFEEEESATSISCDKSLEMDLEGNDKFEKGNRAFIQVRHFCILVFNNYGASDGNYFLLAKSSEFNLIPE